MSEFISVAEIFGCDVFDDTTMRERLPSKVYKTLKQTIEDGKDIDPAVADIVAHEMKEWAITKGATHYTHWFQPMTGVTAEKHDSFLTPIENGKVLMNFSGKELIKGEPDASSFPSGGLRATFEARGYTAWDCTSPAFLRENAGIVTLCIPTAFCSYTGEALDKKTPLLRSMEALNKQTLRILKLFGHDEVNSISCSVGPEQEYFLIDKKKYLQREDLIFTGRTLFGAMPPKGQELDDHYFGSIKERVAAFMRELNTELWRLGVTAKTQHNETAPAQHELAPVYATANIATDHNQLIMECMKKIANRQDLVCLLHEKPFAGVNGSGKHNNWSLTTDTGKNLLDPGKTPHENIQFLLFLAAVICAVDRHADLLRLSGSNPGNDHRLGAQEAPPGIISIFLGTQLEDVIHQIVETGEATSSKQREVLNIGVHTLPELFQDVTDRNRTSSFAFTGNKFEFRMVGSSMSIAGANTTLNTIVADALCNMADELEQAEDFSNAVTLLLKKTFQEHRKIIFNGNGYGEDWVKEAEKRGLPNLKTFVDAIPSLESEKNVLMYKKHHIYSKTELISREEILYESYCKAINIEARTMIQMVRKRYIPSVIHYTTSLADSINAVRSAVPEADRSVQEGLLIEASKLLREAKTAFNHLSKEADIAAAIEDVKQQANYYKDMVFPAMNALRTPIDQLEVIVDKDMWPVPTYGDLLFEI